MRVNEISGLVINAAMKVHTELGPGLLESAYKKCLAYELRKRGRKVDIEVPQPVVYDGVRLDFGYRFDMLVDDAVIVEAKAVDAMHPVFEAQLLSYLKLSGKKEVGLLINFHVVHLKVGIKQMVNTV